MDEQNAIALPGDIFSYTPAEPVESPPEVALPRIGVSRDTGMFTLEGQDDAFKELHGVILSYKYTRSYYGGVEYNPENPIPPSCVAFVAAGKPCGGTDIQCESCANCALSQFIENDSPECSEKCEIFVLLDGEALPRILTASSANMGRKKPLTQFIMQLKAQTENRLYLAHVVLRLQKANTRNNQKVALIDGLIERIYTPENTKPEEAKDLTEVFKIYKDFNDCFLPMWVEHFGQIGSSPNAYVDEDTPPPTSDCPV